MPVPIATIAGLVASATAGHPTARVTIYGRRGAGQSVNFAELRVAADRFAAGLTALGWGPGDRLGLPMRATLECYTALLGSLTAGVAVITLPSGFLAGGLPAREQERSSGILRAAEPRAVFAVAGEVAGTLTGDTVMAAGADRHMSPTFGPDVPALIQFTSGSTSDPKGAVLTQGNLAANVTAIGAAVGMGPADTVDLWLPLFHDMGLIGSLTGLCSGANLRLCSPAVFLADPFGWLREFAAQGSTISPAPHFAYRMLVDTYDPARAAGLDLSAWRVAFNGAEPIDWEDLGRFQETFRPHGFPAEAMLPVYGMAEATLAIAFPEYGRPPVVSPALGGRRYVSVGRGIGGMAIDLRPPPAVDATDWPAGTGEIWVRGPSLMQGYLLPGRGIVSARDSDGWFATGDLGFTHDGELFVCGRVKELLIIRGRKLFPQEIEWAARATHPLAGLGGRGCAVAVCPTTVSETVTLAVEADSRGDLPSAQLRGLAGNLTEQFGVAVAIVVVPERTIPRTTSGKFRRHELYQRLQMNKINTIEIYNTT